LKQKYIENCTLNIVKCEKCGKYTEDNGNTLLKLHNSYTTLLLTILTFYTEMSCPETQQKYHMDSDLNQN